MDRRCLLTVHAHPDDEASKGPATIARYAADGVRTVLVCCTDGSEGDIHNPAIDAEAAKANLAAIRAAELEASTAAIGYSRVVQLGYRDSGMKDDPANEHPGSFHQAPLEEAVGRLVAVLREERPQVLITYPEVQEQYPHPDHLKVNVVSEAAFTAAADPDFRPDLGDPWAVAKLYYVTWPVQRMLAMHAKFDELGLDSPYDASWLERVEGYVDDSTMRLDVTGYGHVRELALKAHATQIDPTSPWWFGLPSEVAATVYPYDHYRLAISRVGPLDQPEDDLFAGIS